MAITTTTDDVICIAPELAGQETRVEKFIEYAKLSIDENVWLAKANLATALLAAHMITALDAASSGNGVKRKKVGDMEIEFGNASPEMTALMGTSYGMEFLRLRKSLVITPLVAGC